jgi:hypothetical protein
VLAELTLSDEVWLAVIQAIGVALGVGGGIVGGFMIAAREAGKTLKNQRALAMEQRRHEAKFELDKFQRHERIEVYRRLVAAAGPALETALFAAGAGEGGDDSRPEDPRLDRASEAYEQWFSALSEAHLIGAESVVTLAFEIDQLRANYQNAELWDTAWYSESLRDNADRVVELTDACRADLARIEVEPT